jgi:hypothetical protein
VSGASPTAELLRIFGAVRFLWPGAFSFAGRLVQAAVPAPGERIDPVAPPPVVTQLQQQLYLGCYCVPFAGRPGGFPPEPAEASAEREIFVQSLAEANSGRERRLSGVLRPRESRRLDEIFYFAFGETPGLQEDGSRIVRLYWNVGRAGAPRLVAVLTRRLNRFRLPFQLKCLNRPRQFERLDACVLFVQRRHFRPVAELIAGSWPELAPELGLRTPLFTKRLAPGLGLAEEPGVGESFGSGRCRLVAEGIWRAWLQGSQDGEDRLRAVAAEFRRCGLDLDRPYLGPASADVYEMPDLPAVSEAGG